MDFFTFIVVVVAIVSGTEMLGKIFGPGRRRARHLDPAEGDAGSGGKRSSSPALDPDVATELIHRLVRVEERLDFLEELKAPPRRTSLPHEAPREDPER